MARNKRPSKQYRPRAKNRMAALTLLNIRQRENALAAEFVVPLPENEQRDTAIVYGTAFDRIYKGEGTTHDAQLLADMCNTAMVLCERGFGEPYVADAQRALDLTFEMGLRFRRTGVWELDMPTREALSRAYDLYCGQLQIAGQGHIIDAEREVLRRCSQGNYYRTVPVKAPATAVAVQ